ncbi:MAG: serine/threonine protein kinase [Gammaproteobacteria bacterium]
MSKTPIKTTFNTLLPDDIVNSLEACGWPCDGRIQALASYENRVYQIGLSDRPEPIIAKFYRPERWTDEQILEEFEFTDELAELELPVLTPLSSPEGPVLCHKLGFRFAVYPHVRGHAPYLDDTHALAQIGRLIARIHSVGQQHRFEHRENMSFDQRAVNSAVFIVEGNWIPDDLRDAYEAIIEDLLGAIDDSLDHEALNSGRLHGDMHVGNLLWEEGTPSVLDFDDACNGPPMQDLWMFLSGNPDEMQRNLNALAEGYEMFRQFPTNMLDQVEALRAMRILYHTAWLARRWTDPAFPRAFPWFNTQKFWQEHILTLKEQLALLWDPPRLHTR